MGANKDVLAEWKESVHAARNIGCEGCHGGNPKAKTVEDAMSKEAGFIVHLKKRDIPGICARCHADPKYMRPFNIPTSQFAQYKESVHGKRLLKEGDTKVAACTDCHGVHDIKPVSNVQSPVYKTNIPATCAKCHADAKYMASYRIPTNQFEQYQKSVHGRKLLVERDKTAPACADCHGTHGATPPKVKEVADVCGQCHAQVETFFNKSPHRAAVQQKRKPRCVDCHGYHGIQLPRDAMLAGTGDGHCGSCHQEGTKAYQVGSEIHRLITQAQADYEKTQDTLHQAEQVHMDVVDQRLSLENAWTALIEARTIQHTLALSDVEGKVKQAQEIIQKANNDAMAMLRQSVINKIYLALAGIFVLFAAVVLYFKWVQLSQSWQRSKLRRPEG